MSKSVIIYARVGSPEQVDLKLDEQIEVCSQFATDKELNVERIYKDIISANKLKSRFDTILEDMIKSDIEDLIIHDLSRISRNHLTVSELKVKFKENGKYIIPVIGD